jgi:hypothetical protein
MLQPRPQLHRCHHLPVPGHNLPADQTITAEDIDQFVLFAEANGYEPGSYSTTGMFTAEALLRARTHMRDGWTLAHIFWWDFHGSNGYQNGTDFVNQALLPGWPKKLEEGTERPQMIRILFR